MAKKEKEKSTEKKQVEEKSFEEMISGLQLSADYLMSQCKQVGNYCRSKNKSGDRFFLAATMLLRLKMANFKV